MKIKVNRKKLLEALSQVKLAISRKVYVPVLKNAKLKVSDARSYLILTGTDLENIFKTFIDITDSREYENSIMEVTVECEKLEKISKMISGEFIYLTLFKLGNEVKVSVSDEKMSMDIEGIAAEEYPIGPKIKEKLTSIMIPAEELVGIFKKALPFMADSYEPRIVLQCLHLKLTGNNLIMEATDGRHLFRSTTDTSTKRVTGIDGEVNIPKETIETFIKILSKVKEDVSLNTYKVGTEGDEIMAGVKFSRFTSLVKVIDATYPSFDQVLHKEFPESLPKIFAGKKDLLDCLKGISGMYKGKFAKPVVRLEFSDEKVVLHGGEADDSFDKLSGPVYNLTIRGKSNLPTETTSAVFNVKFVINMVNIIDGDSVCLEFFPYDPDATKYHPTWELYIRSAETVSKVMAIAEKMKEPEEVPMKQDDEGTWRPVEEETVCNEQ